MNFYFCVIHAVLNSRSICVQFLVNSDSLLKNLELERSQMSK